MSLTCSFVASIGRRLRAGSGVRHSGGGCARGREPPHLVGPTVGEVIGIEIVGFVVSSGHAYEGRPGDGPVAVPTTKARRFSLGILGI